MFATDGTIRSPGYVTAFINDFLVQDHTELRGETVYIGRLIYRAYARAPINLQAHGNPSELIDFRDIWVPELDTPEVK